MSGAFRRKSVVATTDLAGTLKMNKHIVRFQGLQCLLFFLEEVIIKGTHKIGSKKASAKRGDPMPT